MDAQELQNTLEKFRKEGAHLLLPSTYIPEIPRYHSVAVDQVFINPETTEGDVYVQQKKLALTRQGLMKLANAAGMIWDPNRCGRLDDRSDKDYVVYQAVGGFKKLDGTPLFMKAEYDLDFEIIRDEIEEGYEQKRNDWVNGKWRKDWFIKMSEAQQDAYIQKCIRRDLLQKRKHKIKLAETGAMTRVIRGLLNLKSAYTKPELTKPFIVVRLVFQPDYDDPEIKTRMAAAAVGAVTGVFGPAPTAQPALPPATQDAPITDAETIDAPLMDDEMPQGLEPEPAAPEAEPAPDEPGLEAFLGMKPQERLAVFGTLAKKRGMQSADALWGFWKEFSGRDKPPKPSEMPEEDMVKLFEALQDIPVGNPDEIPF